MKKCTNTSNFKTNKLTDGANRHVTLGILIVHIQYIICFILEIDMQMFCDLIYNMG